MRERAAERRLRLCDGRLEKPAITKPCSATEALELASVQREDDVDREKDDRPGFLAE